MPQADKFKLVVSALMGTPYIAALRKDGTMGDNRREVPKGEFIKAVLEWAVNQLADNDDTVNITINGKVVAEIIIKDKSLI